MSSNRVSMRSIARSLVLACVVLVASCAERPVTEIDVTNPRPEAWPDEVVDAFGRVPVQDRGRVKPMSTYAGFRMLSMNGKQSWTIPEGSGLPTDGETLDPVRLTLDVMLFEEQARKYELFLVNDNAVLDRIGLSFENRKRRDRYSYDQLVPGRAKLDSESDRIRAKAPEDRERVEKQMLALQQNLFEFELLGLLGKAWTVSLGANPSERLLELYPEGAGGRPFSLATALSRYDTVLEWVRETERDSPEADALVEEVSPLVSAIDAKTYSVQMRAGEPHDLMVATIPPADASIAEWTTPGMLALSSRSGATTLSPTQKQVVDTYASVALAAGDMQAATRAIGTLEDHTVAAAKARGEYKDIPLERSYYERDYFTNALVFFLLGFLVAAASWVFPRVKALRLGVWATALVGLGFATVGITVRCILLDRPPVATLYETILFITACGVFACLVTELITKSRITLGASVVLGAAGMFLANKYELHEAKTSGDTMGGLMAVLNTNFWLATHVTTVTLGYSAGLLAAFLGHIWLGFRFAYSLKNRSKGLTLDQGAFLRRFGKIVYGVVCFGLLFSVVGTILGGVWANDSWGRFWGWDPKENGALMIVLYELVIVHSRLGGYVKDYGVAVLCVLGGAIVAFSWWHVNQLGVGLHSYGFTDGVMGALAVYYSIVAGTVILAVSAWVAGLGKRGAPVGA